MDGSSRVDEFGDEAIDISEIATAELHSIGDLLDALHLSKWTNTFREEKIDLPTLFFLQDEHLIRLNVPMSERIKLLRCIQLMKDVPPPSAEMMAKWNAAAPKPAVMPIRPPPRVTFEEKAHEVGGGEEEEEKYEDYQAEEEQQYQEEEQQQEYECADNSAAVAQEEEYASEAAGAGAMAAGAVVAGILSEEKESKAGESFVEGDKAHSMVFLRSEAAGKSEQIYGRLQEAFEDDLRAGMVAFVPSDDADQVLQCLEVFLQDSKPTDDLLWVVIAGSGTTDSISDGLTFGSVLDKVERGYRGSRAIFVIDSNSNVEIPEEDEETLATKQQANPNLQFAVLYAMSSSPQNEFAMSLNLLDTIRGLVPVMPPEQQQQSYTISELVGDALEMQRFFKDATGEEVLIEFIATPEFVENDLPIILPEKMPIPKTAVTDHCGKRALYEGNRPVQILEMNGPERAYVRFMVEVSDPEWVNLGDLTLLESTEQVMEVEEDEEQDSGTGRPLPMPTMNNNSSEDLLAEDQAAPVEEEEVAPMEEAEGGAAEAIAEEPVISEIEETAAVEEESAVYEEPVASEEVLEVEEPTEEVAAMETEENYAATAAEEESPEVQMEAVEEEFQAVEEQVVVEEELQPAEDEPIEQVYEEHVVANEEIIVEEQPVEMEEELLATGDQQEPDAEMAAEEVITEEIQEAVEQPADMEEQAMVEQDQDEVIQMEEEVQMIDQEVDESQYHVVDEQAQDEIQVEEAAIEPMQEEVLEVEEEEDVMTTNEVPFMSTTPKLSLAEIESIQEMELMDDIPADDAPDMGHTDEPPVTMMHEEIILEEFDDEMEPVEEIVETVIE